MAEEGVATGAFTVREHLRQRLQYQQETPPPCKQTTTTTHLTAVESSMIHAVGYEEETRALEVVFTSGVYRYVDVDREELRALASGRVQRALQAGEHLRR